MYDLYLLSGSSPSLCSHKSMVFLVFAVVILQLLLMLLLLSLPLMFVIAIDE